jgi:cardiolipin synthase A/B
MSRSLFVLPDDTSKPFLDAIQAAEKSIDIKMFLFSDPGLRDAVIAAQKRGVKVRVMLNPARRDGEEENKDTRKALTSGGVNVFDSNPAFDLTHEKSMIVDDKIAWVMSLNWEPKNLNETRDYALTTSHPHEVGEILDCFNADWNRKAWDPGEKAHLIWCNGNGRSRIAAFIDETSDSLWVENERYQDPVIIERLVRASRRGVKIHVLARPAHKLKKDKLVEAVGGLRIMNDVGIKVHRMKGLKLHAKMLFADNVRAVIGSINLAPGSFDSRRELAMEVRDDDIVSRLHHVIHHDWEQSAPMDLTDEGLLADLEDHESEGAETLAIGAQSHKAEHKKSKAS